MKKEKEWIYGLYDPVFKSIMTDPNLKDYLSYLICEITDLEYDYVYDNLLIVNGELSIENINEKQYRTDLLIDIEDNKINIEANSSFKKGSIIKNNTYLHKIASNHKKGEDYEDINIYQINFNDYNMFKKDDDILSKVMLTNVKTGEIEEVYQKFYINLARIRKKLYNKEELSLFEKRCVILSLKNKEEILKIIKGDNIMERVYDKMEQLNNNKSIIDEWNAEKEDEKARRYDMKIEKEKAIKQGMKQGINSRNVEITKNLLKNNVDIETISKSTGLSVEEIEKLK